MTVPVGRCGLLVGAGWPCVGNWRDGFASRRNTTNRNYYNGRFGGRAPTASARV